MFLHSSAKNLRTYGVVVYEFFEVFHFELLDSETKVQRVRCPVSLELCPLDTSIALRTGMISFLRYCTTGSESFQ